MYFQPLTQGLLPRIKDIPNILPPVPFTMALPKSWSFSEVSQEVLS